MAGVTYELRDLMVVDPVRETRMGLRLSGPSTGRFSGPRIGGPPVASPGTYDQKHIARIAGIPTVSPTGLAKSSSRTNPTNPAPSPTS